MEQSVAASQSNLAIMHYHGHGTPKDYVTAYMWWGVAMYLGDTTGIEYIDKLNEEMSPSQIDAARRLARECVEKKYIGCGE